MRMSTEDVRICLPAFASLTIFNIIFNITFDYMDALYDMHIQLAYRSMLGTRRFGENYICKPPNTIS